VITTPSHTGNKKRFILKEKLHIVALIGQISMMMMLMKMS